MARITDEERARFHKYLDCSIDKMNSPKNCQKPHWSTQFVEDLFDHLEKEVRELGFEVKMYSNDEKIIDESDDVINIAMMIIDNLTEKP